ncbi:MAG: hypothetical protein K2M98_06915 [Muribaculum sp.]|nr:hypothetical protein [Muribaculum sp.]
MKTTLSVLFAAGAIVVASATTPLPMPDSHQAGSQHYAYPYRIAEPPAQTPAPSGYEAFHMEHYGRHGSRWHNQAHEYSDAADIMSKAKANGKLTPLGEKVYSYVDDINRKSQGRLGDLTDIGALEHQDIGRRMVKNYPTIFAPGTHVDAKSSVVVRCIISMLNELKEIQAGQPEITITSDASWAEMPYMVPGWTPAAAALKADVDKNQMAQWRQTNASRGAFTSRLFNDSSYVADSVNVVLLGERLFWVLEGAQNHLGHPWLVDEVFTPEELQRQWSIMNGFWHIESGLHDMTKRMSPYQRASTLKNFIESADTAMVSPRISANMRFGHDGIVYPLAILMELNGLWQQIDDFNDLAGRQHDYLTIPMACNIQMVFYRPTGTEPNPDNVLVKVLLNENEVTLPVEPSQAGFPYYPWPAVRQFYLDKLANAPEGAI